MHRSRLLTTDDWPETELRAAVLAGELMPVGDCWASVAEPADEHLRAAAYAWSIGDVRLVAARRSAAWIWGARSRPPLPHDVAVPYANRIRNRSPGVAVREVDLPAQDVVEFAGARVTTPSRTVLDLLREPEWDESAAALVCALVALAEIEPTEVVRRLAALRRTPMARRAEVRLAPLLDVLERGRAAVPPPGTVSRR